jgi:hypothetical protein
VEPAARPRLGDPVTTITHFAGLKVQVGTRLRQRCAWCGAMLADYDLQRIAVPLGQDPTPGMWAPEELVRVEGNAYFAVEHKDGDDVPADSCAMLDDAVTA